MAKNLPSSRRKDAFETKLDAAVDQALKNYFPEIDKPTAQQKEAWQGIFQDKDVLAILPTGSGKSLIYQAAPAIASELGKQGFAELEGKSIILVVTPLVAIIDTQVTELKQRGISAINLANEVHDDTMKQLHAGKFQVIFGTPETWVGTNKWMKMLKSEVYQKKLIGIVADEAHCVPKW